MKFVIGILIACSGFMAQAADDSIRCVPKAQIEELRRSLITQQQEYQQDAWMYSSVLSQKLDALTAVNKCQSEINALDDAVNALSFEEPKCNREIRRYNFLEERANIMASMLDARRTQLNVGISSFRSLQILMCQG